MLVTSTQQNSKTKRHDFVELSRYLNNSKGFTLIEILIGIAIISILAAVVIPQYTQYKVRAYDAHSKQALHDMNLTCKAFWTMEDSSEECDLAKAKEFGFVQNSEVVANVLSTLPENFCASAKHNKSPNNYSSDYVGVVSDNADCGMGIAAELEAKAEAVRLAEADRIRYASCENFADEVSYQSLGGENRYTKRLLTAIASTRAVFIPNEMFYGHYREVGHPGVGSSAQNFWTNNGANKITYYIDSPTGERASGGYKDGYEPGKSKGWCYIQYGYKQGFIRRPGCSDKINVIHYDKGDTLSNTPNCKPYQVDMDFRRTPNGMTNTYIGKSIVRGLKCQGIIEERPGEINNWVYANDDPANPYPTLWYFLNSHGSPNYVSCP
jgi:type IV pilus assembly protein PilA